MPYASFLDELVITYGPVARLGRFFLDADQALRQRGVTLSFGTMDELARTNAANRQSWLPLFPAFNPAFHAFDPARTVCFLGRNAAQEVVATHAVTLLDWRDSNFRDEAESLRLHYDDPAGMRRPGESCRVTAPSAARVSGRVAFTGAAWYRPDFRGRSLASVLSPLARVYSLACWDPDFTVRMISEALVKKGFADECQVANVEWSVDVVASALDFPVPLVRLADDGPLEVCVRGDRRNSGQKTASTCRTRPNKNRISQSPACIVSIYTV